MAETEELELACVNERAEAIIKKMATALCETHLAAIPFHEIQSFVKRTKVVMGDRTRSKINMVQCMLRTLHAKDIPVHPCTVGLDSHYKAY